jgi:hypothetical protein
MDDLSLRMLIESFLRNVEKCEHAAGDGVELIGATWPPGLDRLYDILDGMLWIEHE